MEVRANDPAFASAHQCERFPEHVAIIMDGNGRWASDRGLPRIRGHREGAERLREIVQESASFGIRYLTVFAFSTENWKRSSDEINGLMTLFRMYARSEVDLLVRNGVQFRFVGDPAALEPVLADQVRHLEDRTRNCARLVLSVAVNYGARDEIVRAARRISSKVAAGLIDASDIDESTINEHLYTAYLPDPDLIIRTSGECRLSNFMLWQSAYSEFEFVNDYWPDFTPEKFRAVLDCYGARNRRFGAAGD